MIAVHHDQHHMLALWQAVYVDYAYITRVRPRQGRSSTVMCRWPTHGNTLNDAARFALRYAGTVRRASGFVQVGFPDKWRSLSTDEYRAWCGAPEYLEKLCR